MIFQNGGRPPCWIFEIWHFHHLAFVCVRLCLRTPNFALIPQYIEPKNNFQYGVRPPSWMWEFLNFLHISVALLKICVCVLDFVKFGRFAAEIWSYNDFQNGGCPPCWIFYIWNFSSPNLCTRAIMPPNSKFRLNRTIWSRVIAKKRFSIWRSSAILNLGISEIFSHFRHLGQNLRPLTKFRHIRTIRGWDMEL